MYIRGNTIIIKCTSEVIQLLRVNRVRVRVRVNRVRVRVRVR